MSEPTCRCAACASRMANGQPPLPGISVAQAMHITAGEVSTAEQRREAEVHKQWLASPMMQRSLPPPRKSRLSDDDMAEVIGTVLAELHRETNTKIAALEAKINRFEAAANVIKGTWSEGRYERGSIVSIPAVGIYRALADTDARPGSSEAWQLLLKAGRDGRDGKDFTPPEPPPQRTVRTHR